jgi:hypothetical protein
MIIDISVNPLLRGEPLKENLYYEILYTIVIIRRLQKRLNEIIQ